MIPDRRDRSRPDRRLKSSPWYAFRGDRRKGPRRLGDPVTCDDRLAYRESLLAGVLLTLSLLDALATLCLLHRGCEEANPAMRALLDHGPFAFLMGKFLFTVLGVLFLLNYRYHRFFADHLRIGHLLFLVAGMYAALNLYQVALLVIV